MKIFPVCLKNNIESELYINNADSSKLVLKQLVCKDSKTFDISRCVLYINDAEVNFIKGDWTNQEVFYINGLADKTITKKIKPFSYIKLKIKVDCEKDAGLISEDIKFQLHLDLEPETVLM